MIWWVRAQVAAQRQLSWAFGDQIVVSGYNFVTGVLLARGLGVQAFGVYSLAWLFVLFVQSLQHAVILSPMASIGPKQEDESTQHYYGSVFTQQIAFAAFAGAALVPLSFAEDQVWFSSAATLALPLAACIITLQCYEFIRRYNFTISRARVIFWSDFGRGTLQLILLLVAFHAYEPSVAAILWLIAATNAAGVLLIARSSPSATLQRHHLIKVFRRHFHYSKWLLGSALAQWTTGNLFVIAAGALLGPAAVGAIKASQTLVGVVHIPFQVAENMLPPLAARMYMANGLGGLKRFARTTLFVVAAGTAIFCLVVSVPAEFWLEMLFGPEYAPYAPLVAIFAASYFLVGCSMAFRFSFLAIEWTQPIFLAYMASTAVTVIVAYPMVETFGAVGAVSGIFLTQALMLLFYIFYFTRMERVQ